MSDPLLPPGIRIGAGVGEDERPVGRIEVEMRLPRGGVVTAAIVLPPRQLRAFGALCIRQADLIELAECSRRAWRSGEGGR